MKNQILWKIWKDPLTKYTSPSDNNKDDDDDTSNGDRTSIAVIMGPMGVMSVDDGCLASSNTKFYVGHTNFTITMRVADLLKQIPGVETLKIISRYRFLVSFGKIFKDDFVKQSIECALGIIDDKATKKEVSRMQITKRFCSTSKNWAICELPDGKIEFCKDDQREPVFQCIERFKAIKGAKISTSWD